MSNVCVYGVNTTTGSKICQVLVPRPDGKSLLERAFRWADFFRRLTSDPIDWRFFEVEHEDREAHVEVERRYGVRMF